MIRFQADADLNRIIVRAVHRLEPAIDFRTAAEAGLEGVEDPDVLALAADAGRVLVTHDQRTIRRIRHPPDEPGSDHHPAAHADRGCRGRDRARLVGV